MWCDSFDIDLYKAVPAAREVLAPVKDVVLFTHGHLTDEKLNHPSCWHTDHGMAAFFAFRGEPAPEGYWTDSPVVRCTFEEAVRDLWVHSLVMVVERRLVWDASKLKFQFDRLMYGWHKHENADVERAQLDVIESIGDAVNRFRTLVEMASVQEGV